MDMVMDRVMVIMAMVIMLMDMVMAMGMAIAAIESLWRSRVHGDPQFMAISIVGS